jgi:hypothetical protein
LQDWLILVANFVPLLQPAKTGSPNYNCTDIGYLVYYILTRIDKLPATKDLLVEFSASCIDFLEHCKTDGNLEQLSRVSKSSLL